MRLNHNTNMILNTRKSAGRVKSLILAGMISGCIIGTVSAIAEDNENSVRPVSPARGIQHDEQRQDRPKKPGPQIGGKEYRSYDGSGNNIQMTEMGATHTELYRLVPADYGDGESSLAGQTRPSPREISNAVFDQVTSSPNELNATDYLWQWGQFLDHDIDLTDGVDPAEPADIPVPLGDMYFDIDGSGDDVIQFNRSIYLENSSPRQQLNEITAWIDASNVYGSDEDRARALRTLAGDGKLKTSDGDLLPFNVDGLPNAGGSSSELFLAGDVRANEQTGLTAMHTLFVREHNRLAERISTKSPELSGEQIYQRARQLVAAQMQVITYYEYLPALLGPGAMSSYRGYNDQIDAGIANLFSTAAYRYGHSALNEKILRVDEYGHEIPFGHLSLKDAFFNPSRISDEGGIEPTLRGLAMQASQTVDALVIDDVRNFLFGAPGSGGFDLVSLNIQRGRDHGLPSYNDVREEFGFSRALSFFDITEDSTTQARLSVAYDSVDDIDLWVGGLSEDPLPGSHVGPLFYEIIKDQFEALRDGDRFWYARTLNREDRDRVESLRLADIIRLNTEIGKEIPNNVFYLGTDNDRSDNRSDDQLRHRQTRK